MLASFTHRWNTERIQGLERDNMKSMNKVFNKNSLSVCYILGTVFVNENIAVNKRDKNLCL